MSLKDERRGKLRHGVHIQQGNAAVHTSQIATDAVKECGFEVLLHPAYSPDLTPISHHLFLKPKRHPCGKSYSDDNGLADAVWSEGQTLPSTSRCVVLVTW